MKLVCKPLEDIKLMLGLYRSKIDKNIKFVKVDSPVSLVNKFDKQIMITICVRKFSSIKDLEDFLNTAYISHFYYLSHEVLSNCIKIRFYAE